MFDIANFIHDLGFETAEKSNQHYRKGWININCPFCGDDGKHLGFPIDSYYGNCYRCGKHTAKELMECSGAILKISEYFIQQEINPKKPSKAAHINRTFLRQENKLPKRELIIPGFTKPINELPHKNEIDRYLISRGFLRQTLETTYQIRGTINVSPAPKSIWIPIIYGGKIISYMCRFISPTARQRWLFLEAKKEIMPAKSIVYNFDNAIHEHLLIVEGITDVWKIGSGAVATFGTSVTVEQERFLSATNFKKYYIAFDSENTAQRKAKQLATYLTSAGKKVFVLSLNKGDPGDLGTIAIKKLRQDLNLT